MEKSCDLIIFGGTVVDGTGSERRAAEVAISGDKIVEVGDLRDWQAGERIDASGLIVTPAFIDIHTHSDVSVLYNPDQTSMLFQGVGTQVVGNCGLGIGQVVDSEIFQYEQKWMKPHGEYIRWKTLAEHLAAVEAQGIGTNYAPLVGHGTTRKHVMGYENRPPTEEEMDQMRKLTEEAFNAGVWGLSSGLEYSPAKFAQKEEVAELSKVAAKHSGFYVTHLRDEADFLVEAVEEAIWIAQEACLPLQLSHHKADGKANWGKVHTTLAMVDKLRSQGMDILLDVYPYLAYQTSLAVAFFPNWVSGLGPDEMVSQLKDSSARTKIAEEIRAKSFDWDKVVIGSARNSRELQGKTVAEVCTANGKIYEEFLMDLLIAETAQVSAVHFSLCEEDLRTVMNYPYTMIGSDAIGTAPTGSMGVERPHPRSYGTFPRVISKYVREEKLLTLEAAVYKMTGLPAQRMQFPGRGVLAPGMFADIIIFNYETIDDKSTFADPHQYSVGVEHLIINGKKSITKGVLTGERAGRVLRKV